MQAILSAIVYDRLRANYAPVQEKFVEVIESLPALNPTTVPGCFVLTQRLHEQFRKLDPPPPRKPGHGQRAGQASAHAPKPVPASNGLSSRLRRS